MVETLSQLFLSTCRTYPKNDLLMSKQEGRYVPISTAEFEARVRRLSTGLRDLGLRPGDKVVIFSENRPEWVITDFAVLCAGGITVPIYTSLMPEQVKYIIKDSDATIVVCSNRELWLKVDAVRKDLSPSLRFVMTASRRAASVPLADWNRRTVHGWRGSILRRLDAQVSGTGGHGSQHDRTRPTRRSPSCSLPRRVLSRLRYIAGAPACDNPRARRRPARLAARFFGGGATAGLGPSS